MKVIGAHAAFEAASKVGGEVTAIFDENFDEIDHEDLVTPETVRTWTYSRVNSGGADVTHGFTFTGNAEQWAEHVDEMTHQGIEIYNATTEENA